MSTAFARRARDSVRRMVGPSGPAPTREQLGQNTMRHVAGAALVVLSAMIAHSWGASDQKWQYVAIAAALIPQVLVNALAVGDADRRRRLRTSPRPAVVPLTAALVLAVAAPALAVTGQATTLMTAAAFFAAAGLAVAAAPVTVMLAPRPARREPTGDR